MSKEKTAKALADRLDELVAGEKNKQGYMDFEIKNSDIAKNIGIDKSMLSKYLNANTKALPDINTLTKIAQYFGTSVDYLIGHVDYRTIDQNLKGAIETTGLSEQAINNIKKLDRIQRSVLSYFLSHPYLANLLNSIYATAITYSVCEELKKSADDERVSNNLREDITTFFDLVLNDAEEKLVFEEYRRDKIAKNVFVATTREIFDNDKAIQAQAIQKRNFLLENQHRNNPQMGKSEETT